MSRVGKKPIVLPKGVKVSISEIELEVQGPKGKLSTPVPPGISFSLEDGQLLCKRSSAGPTDSFRRSRDDSDRVIHAPPGVREDRCRRRDPLVSAR